MAVEEEIYFPALHGLRADAVGSYAERISSRSTAQLRGTLRLRSGSLLEENDQGAARGWRSIRLAQLGLGDHELAEEELIARITAGSVPAVGHSGLE